MRLIFPFGLNENDDSAPEEAYTGSQNFELDLKKKDFRPRDPLDLVATTDNAGDVRGLIQFVKRDNTFTTLVQSGDIVYSWDGSTFTTKGACSTSARLRGATWSLDEYAIITDLEKKEEIKKWDGTNYTTQGTGLINPFAKYAVVWNQRVWYLNMTENGVDLSHVIVASAYEDPTDCTTSLRAGDSSFVSGDEAFFIVAPDLKPINGVAVFRNQLIFSTVNGRIYKITGTDSTNYTVEQFYTGSYAVGDESMTNIGNDVTYMKSGGVIESLVATETFGDVGADDLSRWIPESISGLNAARTVYDQQKQKVYYFVANKCLVLFKDIIPSGRSPWSVYRTTLTNEFNASSAIYLIKPGTTSTYGVYWGDDSGKIYDMSGTGAGGDGGTEEIFARRKTYFLEAQDAGINQRLDVMLGRVKYVRIKEAELNLTFEYGDDYHTPITSITLKGAPEGDAGAYYGGTNYYGGSVYYNTGFTFANRSSSRGFSPTGRADSFALTAEVSSKVDWRILEIEIPAI